MILLFRSVVFDMFFLCSLLFLRINYGQTSQIWLVHLPDKNDSVSFGIENHFPHIDLLQYQHPSVYILLVSNIDLKNFARFIHRQHGTHRVLFHNDTDAWQKFQPRFKRWLPPVNPLDPSYSQRFLSYDEQQQWFDLLAKSNATNRSIRLHHIGRTFENRSLVVVEISSTSHRRRRRRRSAVFIDGGMHAREWLSIGVANFLLIQFLVLRESNLHLRQILRHFDIFILPMMNPDGYEYSQHTDRLWRKNRSPTAYSDFWNGHPACYGVDLNRNFPYQWTHGNGASTNPCSPSYRGSNASSEAEVQSVVRFLTRTKYSSHKFRVYFNLHTYGRLWLLPWTYTRTEQILHFKNIFQRAKRIVSNVMNDTYRVGQASILLYPCSGTSIDFAATLMPHANTLELSPMYLDLPLCTDKNKTLKGNCSVGFFTGPEAIEQDGREIFHAIVEYLYSLVQN